MSVVQDDARLARPASGGLGGEEAGFVHLAVEGDRVEVEAVRPGRNAAFDEHPLEQGGVPKGLDHRPLRPARPIGRARPRCRR